MSFSLPARGYIIAVVLGVLLGFASFVAYREAVEYFNSRGPVVELVAKFKAQQGDSVDITLSGRQLRTNCTYVGLQGFSLAPGIPPKRFAATLTWLTPSADVSRKSVGPVFDLGVWRIQPAPPGHSVIVEETNICGSAVISDSSKPVHP